MWWLVGCSTPLVIATPDDSDRLTPHPYEAVGSASPLQDTREPHEEQETWGLCQVSLTCGQSIPDDPPVTCTITVSGEDGTLDYAGPASVEKRGRSSSGFPKPQYEVEL